MFRDRAIFLFVISAILIPLLFITRELILLGIFIILFILDQIIFVYLFYKEEELKLEQWYAFWTAIAGLGFMLVLALVGRRAVTELLGLILFLIYFIGLVMFLFRKQMASLLKKPKKKAPIQKDLEEFREKDELKELVEFFEPELKPQTQIIDIEEPKIEKIVVEEAEEKKEEEKEPVEEEDWLKHLPKSVVFEEEPMIRELREAPKVDFERVRQDLEKIDTDVKTISEKIRLISERAIKEGEKKRKEREAKKKEEKKKPKPKPKKTEKKVYASKTGNKYHYDKNCLGLKRVSKKNFATYANSGEARKKGLKSCGMCR